MNMRRADSRRMMNGIPAQHQRAGFKRAEPATENRIQEHLKPLLQVREKNRRMLAEKFIFENPVTCRDLLPCPYPEMEHENRIDGISSQPDVLHEYAAPRSKCTKWYVKQLAKKFRDGDCHGRAAAAEELAMIVSDPEIYLKETSISALKALVIETLAHGTREAKEALGSLGFDVEKVPRIELIALIASRPKLWFSRKLREGLRLLAECLEIGF